MISGQLKIHQLCIYLRESHLDYRDWRGFYFHRFQCNTNFDFKKIEYELKVFSGISSPSSVNPRLRLLDVCFDHVKEGSRKGWMNFGKSLKEEKKDFVNLYNVE